MLSDTSPHPLSAGEKPCSSGHQPAIRTAREGTEVSRVISIATSFHPSSLPSGRLICQLGSGHGAQVVKSPESAQTQHTTRCSVHHANLSRRSLRVDWSGRWLGNSLSALESSCINGLSHYLIIISFSIPWVLRKEGSVTQVEELSGTVDSVLKCIFKEISWLWY